MKLMAWVASALILAALPAAAAPPASGTVLTVWPGPPPGGALAQTSEIEGPSPFAKTETVVRNVSKPTLTVFAPDPAKSTGAAVVIAPGGGFQFLSIDTEGNDLARWLSARGVTAFVLRYRLAPTALAQDAFAQQSLAMFHAAGSGRMDSSMIAAAPLAVADGVEAIALIRRHAGEWGLDPHRIGIVGFSAGGAVAAGAAMRADGEGRPDFAAPIYAALLAEPVAPKDAPPLFIALAANDVLLGDVPGQKLYAAWKAAKRPVEMHIFAAGNHGFGMKTNHTTSDHWVDELGWWLEAQGVLKSPP